MCRMVFVQDKVEPKELIALYVLLTAAADDRGQRDGWGIAIGTTIIGKGAEPFSYAPRSWTHQNLIHQGNLIGHIRAASPHTTKRPIDAHPYVFKNRYDRTFAFCHNGSFRLYMPYGAVKEDTPYTDTWSAITDLLKDVKILTASHVKKWVQEKTDADDAFVILINDDEGNTHIIRGDKREFHLAETPRGIIGATSRPSLVAATELVNILSIVSVEIKNIEEIPPYTYIRIGKGGEIEVEKLTPPQKRIIFPFPAERAGRSSFPTGEEKETPEILSGGDLERYFSTLVWYYPIRPVTLRMICAIERFGLGWHERMDTVPTSRELVKFFPIMSATPNEIAQKRYLALLWNDLIPVDQEIDFVKDVLREVYGHSTREFMKDFPIIAAKTEAEAEAMIETWKILLKGGKK